MRSLIGTSHSARRAFYLAKYVVLLILGVCISPWEVFGEDWVHQSVGPAALEGSVEYNDDDSFTIEAGGSDIWSNADEFEFVCHAMSGDGVIIARVTSLVNTNVWAKAGVMMRESLDAGSRHAMVVVTPGGLAAFQWREETNGSSSNIDTGGGGVSMPVWVKLERAGTLMKGWYSVDRENWVWIGTRTVSMGATVFVGLAVTSHNSGELTTARIDRVSQSGEGVGSLPSPWNHQDIGSPGVAGYAQYWGGIFTVGGSGSDISGSSDKFQFMYQPLLADGRLTARLLWQQNTDGLAQGGVMIRETLNADSRHAMLSLAINGERGFRARRVSGGGTDLTVTGSATVPGWLRVERSGGMFLGWTSEDGGNWKLAASTSIAMGEPVYTGLAVTSHENSQLSTANFDYVEVELEAEEPSVPSPWTSQDIGSPGLEGFADGELQSDGESLKGVIAGGGPDIWGSADQFHYVWRDLSGEGTIVAKIIYQGNSEGWAKTGVMIRESLDAGSRHAMVVATPSNGVAFQWRATTNSESSNVNTGGTLTLPVWVKLQRSGNTFTGWYSSNGTSWSAVGSPTTITMSSGVRAGVVAVSNNGSKLNISQISDARLTSAQQAGWDSDNNGLGDAWETQHFGSLGQNPQADPDGDGVSNLLEYQQGRDPTKGAVSDTGGQVNLVVLTP